MNRYSYKVLDEVYDKGRLIDHAKKAKVKYLVVVNSEDIRERSLSAGIQTIFRRTHLPGFEDEGMAPYKRGLSPEQYSSMFMDGDRRYIRYIANEGNGSLEEMRGYIEWLSQVAELFAKSGYYICIGNFAPAQADIRYLNAGVYDPLFKVAVKYLKYIIIGVHDYGPFIIPYLKPWSKDYGKITQSSYVNPQNWSYTLDSANSFEFLHYTRYIERAKLFGKIRVVITEFNLGKTSNLNETGYYELYESQIPRPPQYTEGLNGPHSLIHYWQTIWPSKSFIQAFTDQLKWYDTMCPPEVEAICFFCYGAQGWQRFGMDLQHDIELHNWIETYQGVNPNTPSPVVLPPYSDSSWKERTLSFSIFGSRIRQGPSLNTPVLKVVRGREDALLNYQYAKVEGNYIWYPVYISNTLGWMRNDVFSVVQVETPIKVSLEYQYLKSSIEQVSIHTEIQKLVSKLQE